MSAGTAGPCCQLTGLQSFADIARATSDQLLQLPGFGQVKVKRIKDAFEKPFRNNATSALSFNQTAISQDAGDVAHSGKGKERAVDPSLELLASPNLLGLSEASRRTREPSPPWDIELDLNESPPPEVVPHEHEAVSKKRARSPSPVWDIELDLNPSDLEDDNHKRARASGT